MSTFEAVGLFHCDDSTKTCAVDAMMMIYFMNMCTYACTYVFTVLDEA